MVAMAKHSKKTKTRDGSLYWMIGTGSIQQNNQEARLVTPSMVTAKQKWRRNICKYFNSYGETDGSAQGDGE